MKKFLPLFLLLLFLLWPGRVLAVTAAPCDSKTDPECPAVNDPNSPFYGAKANAEVGTPWFVETPQKGAQEFNNAIQNPKEINQFSYSLGWLTTTMTQLGFLAVGVPPTDQNQKTTGGAASFFANGIDFMVANRPASSIDYIAYMGSKLHVPGTPTSAYAADGGYGFRALAPVLPIWTAMRNFAYILFALVFIIIGLMIMFRVKIDPKTAASIQNSLPKIILSLILVTFSYAIAGFLIDLMWVLVNLIFAIFGTISGPIGGYMNTTFRDQITKEHATIFTFFLPGLVINGLAAAAVGNISASFIGFSWWDLLNPPLLTTKFAGVAAITVLAFLIISIAILWALFMTWIKLLGAYANTILAIIFSPLFLMVEAIPGRGTFGIWLRMLLSNLLAFPLVIAFLFIALALSDPTLALGQEKGFVPPLIGGNNLSAIQALIGVGILLTIPRAVEILQELLKTPPFKYGTAFMEPLKWSVNPFGATSAIRGASGGELERRFWTSNALGGKTLARQRQWDAVEQEFKAGKIDAAQRESRMRAATGIMGGLGWDVRPAAPRSANIAAGVIQRYKGRS